MSLTALTVSATDIATLEQGVQFKQSSAANQAAVANSINAAGSTTSVFTYAASLLGLTTPSLGQVNMADTAILEGGTIPVGNSTTTNTLTFLATFLQNQFTTGLTLAPLGVNPTLFASEGLGLALASTAGFKAQYGSLTTAQFVSLMSQQSGVGANFIGTWVANWLSFYTGVGAAAVPAGLTAMQAAFGAAAGDAIGAALFATTPPGPLPLTTVFSTQTPQTPTQFSPNTVKGLVANALIGNAEGQYVTGVSLGALPAHTPLQGEFTTPTPPPTSSVFLTTGVDNATQGFATNSTGTPLLGGFTATANNTTFNGTFGGAGATWTPGDMVTAATGTTGQTFNIQGIGAAGALNVTSVKGNTVSGIQTVNITAASMNGLPTQAVQGDFTANGPEGAWTGLAQLTVTSASSATAADNLTVGPAVAVQVTDTLVQAAPNPLTVNGSLTTTITENNLVANTGGITVNGGSGTTTVSITQTQPAGAVGNDGAVTILDANGASKTAAGTITTVMLDGLSKFVVPPGGIPPVAGTPLDPLAAGTATPNVITDNALANLTVNNTDGKGATLAITDNLTTPTVTTLNLSLNNNGVDAAGVGALPLWIVDTNNEITTLNLSLGAKNSFLVFQDNGLTKITSASTGGSLAFIDANPFEGGVPSTFFDNNNTAVNFDFSGINGPNRIAADRSGSGNQADVYTLGNFGSDLGTAGKFQVFTFVHQNAFSAPGVPAPLNADENNTATINFGSGAYFINDALHNAGINNVHNYVNTAANGTALGTLNTAEPYALIESAFNAGPILFNGGSVIQTGDTLQFKQDNVSTVNATNLGGAGGAASVAAGVATALMTLGAHQAGFFTVAAAAPFGGGNTFVFDHADASLTLTAADALVGFAGLHPTLLIGAPSTAHVIPLTA